MKRETHSCYAMQVEGNPTPWPDFVVYIDQYLTRTVDLISYTIQTLDPILQLEEAAPGSGSACGSIFLNRIFAETLNKKFKNDKNWRSDPEILDTAMDHFENKTKVDFNGKRGEQIPVAGVGPHPGVTRHRLELSSTEIKEIFEPVISEILTLIYEQIQQTAKTVKLILLVGGFGDSKYLKSRIQETFPDIEVKVSLNWSVPAVRTCRRRQILNMLTFNASQTAVVRGALMRGLAEVKGLTTKLPRIRARKARKHYGTEYVTPYKKRQRPNDDGHSPERRHVRSFQDF